MQNTTAVCHYCEEIKPLSAFNRGHIMPQAFGRFDENLVLHGVECMACNDHFGRTIELALARDSKEGLERFEHGLTKPRKDRRLGKRIALTQRGGRLDGAILEWDLESSPNELRARPARQVGFARDENGPFVWFRVEDIPSSEELQAEGYIYGIAGGLSKEDALRIFDHLGIMTSDVTVLDDPRDKDGMVDINVIGRIDHTIKRAIAKIAYGYLAHEYKAISFMDQFRAIRRYVRYGKEPSWVPVTISTEHIIGGLPPGQQLLAHVITVRWEPRKKQVVAQVTLFGWIQYQVTLSTAKFNVPPECIDSGHAFNPFANQLAKLTRNRRLSRPFPLMSKPDFLKARAAGTLVKA